MELYRENHKAGSGNEKGWFSKRAKKGIKETVLGTFCLKQIGEDNKWISRVFFAQIGKVTPLTIRDINEYEVPNNVFSIDCCSKSIIE